MVLLITRQLPPAVMARAAREHDVRALAMRGPLDQELVLGSLQDVNAVLCTPVDRFDAALINRLPPTIKVLSTFSVGLEHIDVSAAEVRNIVVCHTPDVLSVATAEMALTLILMAARRAGEGERHIRAGKWLGLSGAPILGRGVVGSVLGIFGMGRIGRELAHMVSGLDMEVHYRNRSRLTPELEGNAIYHPDDESFLKAIDVLSINAPGGVGTYHWLNAERIALMKPGGIVVNTGRGTTIDDEALIAALKSGHLMAAGLDVFENEPHLHPGYLMLENAVLAPHSGSATVETRDAMGFKALDGIAGVIGTKLG